jgi:glycosyltransferase involved in cell wall biosynthesis
MRTRIGIDGTPLLGERSGIGNYTSRLLEALLRLNPCSDYFLYSNRPLGTLETALARAVPVENYLPQSRWLWLQMVLPRLLAQSQIQLCHFPNLMAPLVQPRPCVITIHDASLFLYSHTHPGKRLLAMRLLLPLVARRAAAVITVSHHSRQDLIRILRLPPEKVHVVYEAAPRHFRRVVDTNHLERVQRRYQLPDQFLLFVGTLEPRKNLARLARAYQQVRQRGYRHHLVLVGPRGWLMGEFEREVERLNLADVVHVVGYIPEADLPAVFSLATLFLFPSLYEGFGLPPLEAMACGTAVLSSNNSSLAEICADAALLVDPTDEQSLADGLACLLADPDWRSDLAQRGLERAKAFSWEQAAVLTTAVYEQVMAL